MEILKDSPSHVTRDLSQHSTEVTAGSDWGEEPGQRSQGLRINAGGNEGVQLEDKMLYGNQIKILCIEIYTFNSQDDFSRMKTLKYWSQNMKDEKRDHSHPLKLMKVWFDLKTISIAELMVRKEIKLCIMAAFQESGAEDRDMQENRKIHYKDFFFFCSFLVHSELPFAILSWMIFESPPHPLKTGIIFRAKKAPRNHPGFADGSCPSFAVSWEHRFPGWEPFCH